MTHVAMARIAIAKIQAFMTSLQGHIEACEQEKRVAKKVTSININCKERYKMKYVSVLWRVVWNTSVSFFTAVSATSHRRKVTTDYLILLVLSERYVSKTLKQCTRPQGHVHLFAR